MTLIEKSFEKIERRAENAVAFSPFPTMISVFLLGNQIISATFIILVSNDLNLDHSTILLFGKELNLCETSPCCCLSAVQVFLKHCGKRRYLLHIYQLTKIWM